MKGTNYYIKVIGAGIFVLISGTIFIFALLNYAGKSVPLPVLTIPSMGTTTNATSTTSFGSPAQTSATSAPDHSTATLLKGFTMTFDEEFNSFSRYTDANGNTTCKQGGSGVWQTVYNFCSRTNPGNAEAEVYTDSSFYAFLKKESNAAAATDPENPFLVHSGVLSITATHSSPQVISAVGPWAQYTSGIITTQFSFSQEYGYFEVRAKLPPGKGLWPAFWLLPEDGSWPPEIDAMEAFGDPNSSGLGSRTQIHYGSHSTVAGESCGDWHTVGVDTTAGFHTYGVDIETTGITYYFDGQPYATCPANSTTNKQFYMLVNLAVGSNASWPTAPNAATPFPATLYVDYVRAYQKK